MKKIIKEILPYILILVSVVLIRTFIITPITVVGSSMYPNLVDKEMLLLSKISYKLHNIERFDIIVIKEDEWIIKRVIGLPGEDVSYKDGILYINGVKMDDPYEYGTTKDFELDDVCFAGSYYENYEDFKCPYDKIPEGYYLVLGDNREISKDSRRVGLINEDEIYGKAVFRFWPLSKIGTLK